MNTSQCPPKHLVEMVGHCFQLCMSARWLSNPPQYMGMWTPWVGYHRQFNHRVRPCQQILFASSHTPVTAAQNRRWTSTDPLLSNVLQYVERVCPNGQARPACHHSGLSVENSRLMKSAFCGVPEWLLYWQVVNSCYRSYMPYIKAQPKWNVYLLLSGSCSWCRHWSGS